MSKPVYAWGKYEKLLVAVDPQNKYNNIPLSIKNANNYGC